MIGEMRFVMLKLVVLMIEVVVFVVLLWWLRVSICMLGIVNLYVVMKMNSGMMVFYRLSLSWLVMMIVIVESSSMVVE